MKKLQHKVIAFTLLLVSTVNAQVGFGTASPHESAIMDLTSLNKGVLVPRMGVSQREAISNPATGLIVFDTTTKELLVNIGNPIRPIWVGTVGFSTIGTSGQQGIPGVAGTNTLQMVILSPTNLPSGAGSTIGGGENNTSGGVTSTIAGGNTNATAGGNAFVGGGYKNNAVGIDASVVGGRDNFAIGGDSSVGGGFNNISNGIGSTICGGNTNLTSASSINSTIAGGYLNTVADLNAFVGGGTLNTSSNISVTISGGSNNIATGLQSTVSGGKNNTIGSFGEWVGGIYSSDAITPTIGTYVAADRIFNIGNGQGTGGLSSNAFTILKNGLATLPSVTTALIANGGDKAVVIKEYIDTKFSKVSFVPPLSSNATGVKGEICVTATAIYTCISANTWVKTTIMAGTW